MDALDTAPRAGTTTLLVGRERVVPGVVPEETGQLYAARRKIHPQGVRGTFRTIRWCVLAVTLAIYYLVPFLRWDRGPHEPSQAVLIDLDRGRLYFFSIELWPQEVTYVMGLLILAAFTLFFMNAVAGRVWCGYLCPQTVWTDLFLGIERLIEGDRRARMRLDAAPWSLEKLSARILKHAIWIGIAWWTGGAWVLYFADAPTLVHQLATFQAPPAAYAAILTLTFTTYTLAGHMREQVCTYMCPWPRIQGALTDDDSLAITYRYDRGEPRTAAKRAQALRRAGEPAGDCVDCRQCVVVCPTGVDIRDGLQMPCIQCGLCADACDAVMTKLGRPRGLIAYDTEANCERRRRGEAPVTRLVRPRTVLYGLLVAAVGGTMLVGLATRSFTSLSVLHDRNPLFVTLADGTIRNGLTLRIVNKRPEVRRFALAVEGVPDLRVEVLGAPDGRLAVGPDATQEFRALAFAPAGAGRDKSTPLTLRVTDLDSGETATAQDHFKAP
ncbi:cytochrome c oxidase accessory protein CcoG [Methylobacterium sp. 4-46]|uniref:cytochrome c oxidase accessory protein CcoG n=1 Tax=unclassified Methylobacterium TaxID=2615210 RepID=UPI000152D30F|nr:MULTISPECIES: cytochrome c oxidase accessory protein CcoG [Methylobacterium]ACA20961.1 cytochrome c oxidase accessory protein CcoG [Methylobacterium sp. 4-46]WFT80116.1 cytochrome c oxidase accessory protein CcoG [Methylobacterium nodulans]